MKKKQNQKNNIMLTSLVKNKVNINFGLKTDNHWKLTILKMEYIMENSKSGGRMEEEVILIPTTSKKENMEQKSNSNMKTNEKLTLIQEYWDKEKTKPKEQYHVDHFGRMQGEYKYWRVNGQIGTICNCKNGNWHGKVQEWWNDGTRWCIDTRHLKKRKHGTQIELEYGKEL